MAIIGITCAYDDKSDRAMLHMGYIRSVAQAGATPILLYMDSHRFTLPPVDGLILSGGGDMSPLFFGRKPTPKTDGVQQERDMFELSLMEQAKNIPVLGICRGMQVMAAALGGDLFDHIDGHVLNISHRHDVSIYVGSRLGRAVGEGIHAVNSLHHQSVRLPGEGMEVCGVSDDGIIEAMEHCVKPYFGVQWHPEKMDGAMSRRLFEFFVALCKSGKRV